jgi:hypothetical protein
MGGMTGRHTFSWQNSPSAQFTPLQSTSRKDSVRRSIGEPWKPSGKLRANVRRIIGRKATMAARKTKRPTSPKPPRTRFIFLLEACDLLRAPKAALAEDYDPGARAVPRSGRSRSCSDIRAGKGPYPRHTSEECDQRHIPHRSTGGESGTGDLERGELVPMHL